MRTAGIGAERGLWMAPARRGSKDHLMDDEGLDGLGRQRLHTACRGRSFSATREWWEEHWRYEVGHERCRRCLLVERNTG